MIKDDNCNSFIYWYAVTFFEGAKWHAKCVYELDKTSLKLPFHEGEIIYHAGAGLELFIDGILALNKRRLFYKKDEFSWSEIERGNFDIEMLKHLRTLPVSSLRKVALGILFVDSPSETKEWMIKSFGRIAEARNRVAHHDMSAVGLQDVYAEFYIIRDVIRRICGIDSLEYWSLSSDPSDSSHYINAWVKLMSMWLNVNKPKKYQSVKEISFEDMLIKGSGIVQKVKNEYADLRIPWFDGKSQLAVSSRVCLCPACSFPALLLKKKSRPVTCWDGRPNASESRLYCPENEEIRCVFCGLCWTTFSLSVYQQVARLVFLTEETSVETVTGKWSNDYLCQLRKIARSLN